MRVMTGECHESNSNQQDESNQSKEDKDQSHDVFSDKQVRLAAMGRCLTMANLVKFQFHFARKIPKQMLRLLSNGFMMACRQFDL